MTVSPLGPTQTCSDAVSLQIRAHTLVVHPDLEIRTVMGWVRAADLKVTDALPAYRPRPRLNPHLRTYEAAQAFMAGVNLLQDKFAPPGLAACRAIYGTVVPPSMDYFDPTHYGPWLLGLASALHPYDGDHVRIRYGTAPEPLALLSFMGVYPTIYDTTANRWRTRHHLEYTLPPKSVQAAFRPIPTRLWRNLKIRAIERTEAPLLSYYPGHHLIPYLQTRTPQ